MAIAALRAAVLIGKQNSQNNGEGAKCQLQRK